MSNNIFAAQQARAAQALSKKVRYHNQVMTIAEYLQCLKGEGYTPAIGEKNKIQYNRTKYNRMTDTREQDEYERKCNERVTEYRAMSPAPDTSWLEITKTEYEYFNSLFPKEEELKPGEQWASEEELKHLFKLETIK